LLTAVGSFSGDTPSTWRRYRGNTQRFQNSLTGLAKTVATTLPTLGESSMNEETVTTTASIQRSAVSLDDKYAKLDGRIYLSGIQALVRLPMMQRLRDQAIGLNTAGFVSGYRGSPLGTLDEATKAYQLVALKPGKPDSAMVGTLGKLATRCAPVLANGINLPASMCGAAVAIVAYQPVTRPPNTS
jgi:hypothetical protein